MKQNKKGTQIKSKRAVVSWLRKKDKYYSNSKQACFVFIQKKHTQTADEASKPIKNHFCFKYKRINKK